MDGLNLEGAHVGLPPIGLAGIDGLPWGSHLCQFFASGDELRDTIVPYFKAGLENDERCLLVAMDPFGANDARNALRAAVADFDRRELAKQIESHDMRRWYGAGGAIESERMADGLLRLRELVEKELAIYTDECGDRISITGARCRSRGAAAGHDVRHGRARVDNQCGQAWRPISARRKS